MKKFKPKINPDVELKLMENDEPFSLMFEKENEGNFREGFSSKEKDKRDYVDFLKKASERYARFTIFYKGNAAGFILVAGIDGRLVGGLYSEYKRKGIYTIARNTLIYELNKKHVFKITSSVDKDNGPMKSFISKVLQTPYQHGLQLNHFNPGLPVCRCETDFSVRIPKTDDKLYHVSFDPNLPEVIKPRLPARSEVGKAIYPEKLPPRFSTSPTPELCFRAIYPNISQLLEERNEKEIKFYLYEVVTGKVKYTPLDLIANRHVYDAHVTLEHVFTTPVFIKRVGKVTFKNTSDDEGLYYLPFTEDKERYHSPKNVVVTDIT